MQQAVVVLLAVFARKLALALRRFVGSAKAIEAPLVV
jgi:hypothetical protein